jgi:NlpC/P60 family putative phage cell wall peptidase
VTTDQQGRTGQSGVIQRREIVRIARSWIGTPYHHQASVRGVGADCLGLLRGVWQEVYGYEAEQPPPYSRDWAEACGREDLLAGAGRHMRRVRPSAMKPGDVLLFRMREKAPAKHVGLLVSATTFVHAAEGAPASEVTLQRWWRRSVVAVFAFPGVSD